MTKETGLPLLKRSFVSVMWASLLMGSAMIWAGPALDDQQAVHEFAAANPDILEMERVRGQEIARIIDGGIGQPSPQAAKLLNPPTPPPDVGDVRVPLHVRVVELWRRDFFVPAIHLAQDTAAIQCDPSQLQPQQFLDAEGRAKGLREVQCERDKLEHYRTGVHNLYKKHEANLLALHLPKSTQAKALAEARKRTEHQDRHLQSDDENSLERLRICEEYIKFIGAHAAGMHVNDGRIEFDDPDVYKASREIAERLKAAAAAAGGSPP